MENEVLKDLFQREVAAPDDTGLQELLDEQLITDVAELIDDFPEHENLIISHLSINRAASVFKILDFPTQERMIESLPRPKTGEIINEMPPDDRTALLAELPDSIVKDLLKLLRFDELKVTLSLLGYPEDSVGRLMTPDYLDVGASWTVEQVMAHIREHGRGVRRRRAGQVAG